MIGLVHRHLAHKLTPKIHAHRLSRAHFIEHLAPIERQQHQNEAAIEFLRIACGLSSSAELIIATKLKVTTTLENTKQVVALLQQFDYSPTDVATMISRYPNVLACKTNLKSKLQLYQTIGLHPKTVAANPLMLFSSLHNRLLPNLNIIKSVVPNDDKFKMILNRFPTILRLDLDKILMPIRALRDYNVAEHVITAMLVFHLRAFYSSNSRFEEALEEIKGMNISTSSVVSAHALGVFVKMRKLWERKMENYLQFGWSREQVISAFTGFPY